MLSFRKFSFSLLASVLLLPSVVLAGGKATLITTTESMQIAGQTLEEQSDTITITWDDVSTILMDFGDPDYYMVIRDGKTYSISQDEGETFVMEMGGMSEMVQAMAGSEGKEDPFGRIHSIEPTGQSETVAGIDGQIYQMSWTEADGSQKIENAVFTDDPLVVEMTLAYLGSVTAMIGSEGVEQFMEVLPKNKKGMLKMGNQFFLESIEQVDPPASLFELPAKPVSFQEMMQGLAGE